ncbi:Pycsar system effector family protein [Streptacidiphilus sp. MAP5-3]|uniref:Pycsar system effector family protein n=1 Tax=unclassified Streptacidiphilus TaxID=2643834 RepID=UPI00351266E7
MGSARHDARRETERGSADRPAQYMFTALHATHQHADTKAGILAAAQAALAGTAGAWSQRAAVAWERGGAAGVFAGVLLALFVCGLVGGVVSLAAALSPRLLRDPDLNRYSFVQLAAGLDVLPADGVQPDESADRRELSHTVRFLARVAVRKHRWLRVAVVCTAVMGATGGLGVVLLRVMV